VARVQRATLVAVPRAVPALADGLEWAGPAELAAGDGDAALAARVARELATRGTGDVWFKTNTARPLFVNEGVVLTTLAELFGDRVPAPLAVDAERGWMLLDDHGEEVGWSASLGVVEEVARSYARMQVEAAGQADRPLAAGCHDRRLDRLAAQAEAWLPQVEATGDLPGIDGATWLSDGELAAVRAALPQVLDCCAELAGFAVPPSIVHGDLHLGNVARGPAGYTFFDWTDACVAHPFLDLVTIRRGTSFAEGEIGSEAELRARLRAARAAGPRLPAGRPGRRPAPGGQLPVDRGQPAAADRRPHGPVDPLVAAPDAGRPGRVVTDGTPALCRAAQPGRDRRRRLAADTPSGRWGRWNGKPRRPPAGVDRLSRAGLRGAGRGSGPVRAGLDQRAGRARQDLVPERARVHPAGGRGHRLADGAGEAPPDRRRLTPEALVERIRRGVVGDGQVLDGPFGPRRVTYATGPRRAGPSTSSRTPSATRSCPGTPTPTPRARAPAATPPGCASRPAR
jgi:hypothetical protein